MRSPPTPPTGPDWYQRATRAHMNCVENLPVYGAIVLVATLAGRHGQLLDGLSVAVLCARVCQTSIHLAFVQTERAVSYRFSFFTVQLIAMLWMAVHGGRITPNRGTSCSSDSSSTRNRTRSPT